MLSEVIDAIKTPARPSPYGELVLKLNHKIDGVNQAVIAREILTEDLTPNDNVKIICGELGLDTLTFIKNALESNANVQVISGNKPEYEKEVCALKQEYPGKISYYKLDFRPTYHGALVGKNMFLEGEHTDDYPYENFLIIKNVWPETINDFNNIFQFYRSKGHEIITCSS
jgi:hypothetical protein